MTLDQILPGGNCRILKITYADRLGVRLLTMGVYPGMILRVVRNAPLRDPMEIECEQIFLSLRRKEAQFIEVVPVS
jgi:ferrous iron transport protein A